MRDLTHWYVVVCVLRVAYCVLGFRSDGQPGIASLMVFEGEFFLFAGGGKQDFDRIFANGETADIFISFADSNPERLSYADGIIVNQGQRPRLRPQNTVQLEPERSRRGL